MDEVHFQQMSSELEVHMNDKVIAEIKSEKGFYIGDICYAMQNGLYRGVWGGKHHYQDGCFEIPGRNLWFAVAGTAYGDGEYEGSNGFWFPVDAGNIGVLPLEVCTNDLTEISGGGMLVDAPGTVVFNADDGIFEIELPNGSEFSINTRDEYEGEDDE